MLSVHSEIRGPLFVEAMEMQKRGINVLKLNTGNPAAFGFELPESIRMALEGNEDKGVAYCDFKGMPDAREAICEYHKSMGIEGVTPDDVFIGNGVSEVVSFALLPLLNRGDEVLLPSPSYSLWGNTVSLSGADPVFYVCDEQSEWYPDLEDIRSKITPNTRAIVVINPNNPTGATYPREILQGIVDLAREHDLIIFADEIYDRLVMDGKVHTSIASLAPDLPVITMNGLSKSHCLCGFRCGWMILSGPRAATEEYRQNGQAGVQHNQSLNYVGVVTVDGVGEQRTHTWNGEESLYQQGAGNGHDCRRWNVCNHWYECVSQNVSVHDLRSGQTFDSSQFDVVLIDLVDHVTSHPQSVPSDRAQRQADDWQNTGWTWVSGRVHRWQADYTGTKYQYQRVGNQRRNCVYEDGVCSTNGVKEFFFVHCLHDTHWNTDYHRQSHGDQTVSHRDTELVANYFNNCHFFFTTFYRKTSSRYICSSTATIISSNTCNIYN